MRNQILFLTRLMAVGLVVVLNPFSGRAMAAGKPALDVAGLKAGETIPQRFRYNRQPCSGENRSPEISWKNLPEQAASLAFVVWDEDAPEPGGFYHWVLVNIPRSVSALPEGAGNVMTGRAPHGAVQLINGWGGPGYGGPCPPAGKPHRYHFTLYALNAARLPVSQKTRTADAIGQIRKTLVSSAELVLVLGR